MRIPLRARPGLSVVEVLVALMLVSVGLLGIAGTSALSLRTATTAASERRATERAAMRLAILDAGGCERAASGALDDPDFHERWTVSSTRGVALVDASIDWPGRRGQRRSMLLRSALLC